VLSFSVEVSSVTVVRETEGLDPGVCGLSKSPPRRSVLECRLRRSDRQRPANKSRSAAPRKFPHSRRSSVRESRSCCNLRHRAERGDLLLKPGQTDHLRASLTISRCSSKFPRVLVSWPYRASHWSTVCFASVERPVRRIRYGGSGSTVATGIGRLSARSCRPAFFPIAVIGGLLTCNPYQQLRSGW